MRYGGCCDGCDSCDGFFTFLFRINETFLVIRCRIQLYVDRSLYYIQRTIIHLYAEYGR